MTTNAVRILTIKRYYMNTIKKQGYGSLLVRLFKDAGSPANECSLTEL